MRRLLVVLTLSIVILSPTVAHACSKTYPYRWCGKKHSTDYNKAAIRYISAKRHSNLEGLMYLARRESGYRNLATNGPCLGLFQLHTHVEKRRWASPYWNTNRAITYCRDRYGSVAGAVRHSKAYGWY